jgi:hypothetical protein
MNIDQSILRKIKRCMDLSNSSNENEAAIALKQMRKLMDENNVNEFHVMAHEVNEQSSELSVKNTPPKWVIQLHNVIGRAMDCESILRSKSTDKIIYDKKKKSYVYEKAPMLILYLGLGPNPEIANYSFDVLYKKLKKARKDFANEKLEGFSRSEKLKLSDAFCEGWILNIYKKVKHLNPSEETMEKIEAYHKLKNTEIKVRDFTNKSRFDLNDANVNAAVNMGYSESNDIEIHAATGTKEQNKIESKSTLLAEAMGSHQDPSFDQFFEYQVFKRQDGYFVCKDISEDRTKNVETEKQIVDFFGFNHIAKELYDRLSINYSIEISSTKDGQGKEYYLIGENTMDYKFVGKMLKVNILENDQLQEIYKLNIKGYLTAIKTAYGYTDVQVVDEITI